MWMLARRNVQVEFWHVWRFMYRVFDLMESRYTKHSEHYSHELSAIHRYVCLIFVSCLISNSHISRAHLRRIHFLTWSESSIFPWIVCIAHIAWFQTEWQIHGLYSPMKEEKKKCHHIIFSYVNSPSWASYFETSTRHWRLNKMDKSFLSLFSAPVFQKIWKKSAVYVSSSNVVKYSRVLTNTEYRII